MDGVQWIRFEYSKDRVKVSYEIRCDVDSVDTNALNQTHKDQNCVYPRACSSKEPYRGNRLQYETECNEVGWALAELNPSLRGKRGLIQRAVDSWRNSNRDQKLRSRRVRRLAKSTKRSGHQRSEDAGSPNSTSFIEQRPLPGDGPVHHHRMTQDLLQQQADDTRYHDDHSLVEQQSTPISPHYPRVSQSLYPNSNSTFNAAPSTTIAGPHGHSPAGAAAVFPANNTSSSSSTLASHQPSTSNSSAHTAGIWGDAAKLHPRKSITVKDMEKDSNLRVIIKLDGFDAAEIPDSFRQKHSVYPRSYLPLATHSPAHGLDDDNRLFDDGDGDADADAAHPTDASASASATASSAAAAARMLVPIRLQDGWTAPALPLPRPTTSRRARERALNELGVRMCWDYIQSYKGRPIFIQRSRESASASASAFLPPPLPLRPPGR